MRCITKNHKLVYSCGILVIVTTALSLCSAGIPSVVAITTDSRITPQSDHRDVIHSRQAFQSSALRRGRVLQEDYSNIDNNNDPRQSQKLGRQYEYSFGSSDRGSKQRNSKAPPSSSSYFDAFEDKDGDGNNSTDIDVDVDVDVDLEGAGTTTNPEKAIEDKDAPDLGDGNNSTDLDVGVNIDLEGVGTTTNSEKAIEDKDAPDLGDGNDSTDVDVDVDADLEGAGTTTNPEKATSNYNIDSININNNNNHSGKQQKSGITAAIIAVAIVAFLALLVCIGLKYCCGGAGHFCQRCRDKMDARTQKRESLAGKLEDEENDHNTTASVSASEGEVPNEVNDREITRVESIAEHFLRMESVIPTQGEDPSEGEVPSEVNDREITRVESIRGHFLRIESVIPTPKPATTRDDVTSAASVDCPEELSEC